jgi:hypothetical protein
MLNRSGRRVFPLHRSAILLALACPAIAAIGACTTGQIAGQGTADGGTDAGPSLQLDAGPSPQLDATVIDSSSLIPPDTRAPADGGAEDSGNDGGTVKKNPARLALVNGIADFGPASPNTTDGAPNPHGSAFRICIGIKELGGVAGTDPLPETPTAAQQAAGNYAGVYAGEATYLPNVGLSLEKLELTFYAYSSESLVARGVTGVNGPFNCAQLPLQQFAGAGGPLVENVDYFKLDTFPSGTFKDDRTYAVVFTGCSAQSALGASKCGDGFVQGPAAVGSLHAAAHELDTAPPATATAIGFVATHASTAVRAELTKMWLWDTVTQPSINKKPLVYTPSGVAPVAQRVDVNNVNVGATLLEAGAQLFIYATKPMSELATESGIVWAPGKTYAVFAVGDPYIGGPHGARLPVLQTSP